MGGDNQNRSDEEIPASDATEAAATGPDERSCALPANSGEDEQPRACVIEYPIGTNESSEKNRIGAETTHVPTWYDAVVTTPTIDDAVREWVTRRVNELGGITKASEVMGHTGRTQLTGYFKGTRHMYIEYLTALSADKDPADVFQELRDIVRDFQRLEREGKQIQFTELEGKRLRRKGVSAKHAAAGAPADDADRGGLPSPRRRRQTGHESKKDR